MMPISCLLIKNFPNIWKSEKGIFLVLEDIADPNLPARKPHPDLVGQVQILFEFSIFYRIYLYCLIQNNILHYLMVQNDHNLHELTLF